MTNPIVDIKVSIPHPTLPGYMGIPVDVNSGADGEYIYINYRRGDSIPITGVTVVEGENASPPIGWNKEPQDLNKGADGRYLYLCWTRDPGEPILDLIVQATKDENPPAPYVLGDWYQQIPTDLNWDADGDYIYLSYLRKHPVIPINPALGIDPDWVRTPKKEYEIARAQVTNNRLIVRTLRLTIDDSQHLPPGSPYHREVVQQVGVTESQKNEVSYQLNFNLGLGFELWGAKINASVGSTSSGSRTTEFTASRATTTTQIWDIPAANFGREVVVCHIDDVVTVYGIPNGQNVLATAINGTPYRGTFVTDQAGSFNLS